MSPDKIDATLHELGREISSLASLVTTQLTHLTSLVEKHDRDLYAIEPPGVATRIDRLEHSDKVRRWLGKTSLGAALAALGTAIANYFPWR